MRRAWPLAFVCLASSAAAASPFDVLLVPDAEWTYVETDFGKQVEEASPRHVLKVTGVTRRGRYTVAHLAPVPADDHELADFDVAVGPEGLSSPGRDDG